MKHTRLKSNNISVLKHYVISNLNIVLFQGWICSYTLVHKNSDRFNWKRQSRPNSNNSHTEIWKPVVWNTQHEFWNSAVSANAVFDSAVEWNFVDKIFAMIFDTTAVNTGQNNGACVLLEHKIGRSLLPLACRHHIFEIIAGNIVNFLLR